MSGLILISFEKDLVDVVEILASVLTFNNWKDFLSVTLHDITREILAGVSHNLINVRPHVRFLLKKHFQHEMVESLTVYRSV